MLYTGKGDDGKTKTFGCDQKISKSSAVTEALGCLDEVNSFLGVIKVKAKEFRLSSINPFPFVIPALVSTSVNSGGIQSEIIQTSNLDPRIREDDRRGIDKLNKDDLRISQIVENIQQNLFIIQAELAGADKKINEEKLCECEKLISDIEKELPPIKTFFVSGGTELAVLFDFARTLARRAERRVVCVVDGGHTLGEWTVPYLNRLSSLLYALARLSNHISGITEQIPNYK
jgi:cob(I)alamin adenosyltransferase